MLDLNLTAAELAVLAEELSMDPRFAIGEQSEEEKTRMQEEGLRSLLARGFARVEGDSIFLSSELSSVAADILGPLGLVTFTQIAGEDATISNVLIGRQGMLNATPIAVGVAHYSTTDIAKVAEAIVSDESPSTDRREELCGLIVLDASEGGDGDSLNWVKTANGSILVDRDGEPCNITESDLANEVKQMILALS